MEHREISVSCCALRRTKRRICRYGAFNAQALCSEQIANGADHFQLFTAHVAILARVGVEPQHCDAWVRYVKGRSKPACQHAQRTFQAVRGNRVRHRTQW